MTEAPAPKRPVVESVDALAELEGRLRARLGAFDVSALVQVLFDAGYTQDELRFAGHLSIVSQPCLVHDVQLSAEPRFARIELNLGLLAAQSPMPGYFFKRLDSPGFDAGSFVQFIGFFDHALIGSFVRAVYPELNRQLFPDWELARRRDLQLTNLRAPSTLHWLFQTTFPELDVRIEKANLGRDVRSDAMRLGSAVLGGDAVFGARATVPVLGRRISLFAESDRAGTGRPWAAEIEDRLSTILFPILGEVGVDLEVVLVIRERETWAQLSAQSFLGYDSVQGGEASYRRIVLHSGYVVA